ncbi:MAG TPA: hypothetical protein VGF71_11065 [Caulobacteraceae bacterium]|jgi:hypothetical protein
MIAEIGFPHKTLYYDQPARVRGKTKNNLFTLFDLALMGLINCSKVPLRLMTIAGFLGSAASFFVGVGFLAYKLLFWSTSSRVSRPWSSACSSDSRSSSSSWACWANMSAPSTPSSKRLWAIERERINFEHEPESARIR